MDQSRKGRAGRRRSAVRVLPTVRVRPVGDGLHLKDSVLYLDVAGEGSLSFISSARTALVASNRVIATEETVRLIEALQKKKTQALICQYHRPFMLGSLKLELLPAGSMLGSALLYVEEENRTILYAPTIQTATIPEVREVKLKKANTLIIGAHHGISNYPPDRDAEKARLLASLEGSDGPTKIYCASIGTAQEIIQLVADRLPTAVHSAIAKVNRVYRMLGLSLPVVTTFSPYRQSDAKVILFPYARTSCSRTRQLPGRDIYLHDTYPPSPDLRPANDEFFLSRSCTVAELKHIVTKVQAQEIITFGNYAKRYQQEFLPLCANVRPLFARHQPTLF